MTGRAGPAGISAPKSSRPRLCRYDRRPSTVRANPRSSPAAANRAGTLPLRWAAVGLVAMFCLLVCAGHGPAGEIYRWRDGNGVLHFSDTPPPCGYAEGLTPAAPTGPSEPWRQPSGERFPGTAPGGVFWRIDRGALAPSYLLGTIHSADPRVLAWSPAVDAALAQATCFIMEMRLDADSFLAVGRAAMLTDGRNLADLLGPSDYRRLQAAMADHPIPESFLRQMKPWVLMAVLSQPAEAGGAFMDLLLYRKAVAKGKPVIGLETAEEQVALIDGLPMADQVALLRATLHQLDELPARRAQLVETYLSGDLAAIAALARQVTTGEDGDLGRRFLLRLNDRRNARMIQRMVPRLEAGGAFVAVGALHLTGPTGIVRGLRERGYRLTPMEDA